MLSGIFYGLRICLARRRRLGAASPASSAPRSACSPPMPAAGSRRGDHAPRRPAAVVPGHPGRADAPGPARARASTKVILALVIVAMGLLRAHGARRGAGRAATEYIEAARAWRLPTRAHHVPPSAAELPAAADRHRHACRSPRAIALEATLSFLGLGVPITEPSLGLLIANGYQYMLSRQVLDQLLPGHRAAGHDRRDQPGRRPVARRAQPAAADDERAATPPCSRSQDLRTHFFTRAGVVQGGRRRVVLASSAARCSGWSANPARASRSPAFRIIGLVDPPGRIVGGAILFQRPGPGDSCREREMRGAARQPHRHDLPGPDDDAEPGAAHRHADDRGGPRAHAGRRAPRRARARATRSAWSASRRPDERLARLSAPVLRRHAPARGDRHRAAAPARPDHRRRADHRARRHDPGADPGRGAEALRASTAPR